LGTSKLEGGIAKPDEAVAAQKIGAVRECGLLRAAEEEIDALQILPEREEMPGAGDLSPSDQFWISRRLGGLFGFLGLPARFFDSPELDKHPL
jgi:hypothetical protein